MTSKNNLKIIIFLILSALIPIAKAFSQNSPTVINERPRIMISPNKFDNLKDYLNGIQPKPDRFQELYEKISTNSNEYLAYVCGNNSNNSLIINLCKEDANGNPDWNWDWGAVGNAYRSMELVLIYYHLDIDTATQIKRINFIADQLLGYLSQKTYSNNTEDITQYCPDDKWETGLENKFRAIARFSAVFYDWGYEAINANKRNDLASKLHDFSHKFMQIFVYNPTGGNTTNCVKFNNTNYFGGHSQQNHFLNMKLVMALYGSNDLNETEEANINFRYNFLFKLFNDEFLKIMRLYQTKAKNSEDEMPNISNEVVSGEYNGVPYSILWYSFLEYFELIYHGTNKKDIYLENPWANHFINQYSSLIRPDENSLQLGDGKLVFGYGTNPNDPNEKYEFEKNILTLANHYDTDANKFMLKQYIDKSYYILPKIGIRASQQLLYLNNLNNVNDIENPFPLNWFSVKSGLSIMNSSKNANATMVSYISKTINQNNHQHLDNNSFSIFKNGPLFIDSGTYDAFNSKHFHNYYKRSIAHNLITIHDNNEIIPNSWSNDGGQIYNYSIPNYSGVENSYNPNVWKIYSDNQDEGYTYHVTDASKFYHQNKVTSYIRKFLYLKNLDRVIVADYVKQPNKTEQFDVRWNAHFKNKPVIFKSPYKEDLVINDSIKIEHYSESNKFKIDNGTGGNATIKTLFPTVGALQAKLIGSTSTDPYDGCYYIYGENDTEGINYIPKNNGKRHITDGAKWRLEISQTGKPQHSIFINTIDIGDNNNVSKNTSTLVSNVIHPSGLSGSMTVGWESNNLHTLYTLATEFYGNSINEHIINVSNLEAKTYKLLAFDLMPNTEYCLSINGLSITEPLKTNAQGIFSQSFNLTESQITTAIDRGNDLFILDCGNNNVYQSKKKNNTNNQSLKIFPNSVKHGNDLTISISGNTQNNTIKIYDLTGKLVLEESKYNSNSIVLKNLKLSIGIYILKLENINGTKTKKLIIK